jgi:hypothetical protein
MGKKLVLLGTMFWMAAIASAEVTVGDKTDPIDGSRLVTLMIRGDVAYSGNNLPVLSVACRVRKGKALPRPRILLDTATVAVDRITGGRGQYSAVLRGEMIHVEHRFDQDPKPHMMAWVNTSNPGILWTFDKTFLHNMLGPSKKVFIQVASYGAGAATVGFDLTGFAEAFAKQDACEAAK